VTEPLSPAAIAVDDALAACIQLQGEIIRARPLAAAALRAAADQVVPWKPEPTEESVGPTIDFGYAWALFSKANDVREELFAIADELEGAA
jgi:hypothetical protein